MSLQLGADGCEGAVELVAEGGQRADDHNGYERGDHAVFDRGSTGLILQKAKDHVQFPGCDYDTPPFFTEDESNRLRLLTLSDLIRLRCELDRNLDLIGFVILEVTGLELSSDQAGLAACALMDEYFIPMAERVFGDAAIPQDERLAMTLVRRLRSNRLAQFNAREVRREAGGDLREAANMTTACNVLVDHGLIRHRETNSVGRPAKIFDVHPAVYGRS